MKFEDGKIYRITDGEKFYIGSTTLSLSARMSRHKEASKKRSGKLYDHINKVGWDHVRMELVKDYPCETQKELREEEERTRRELGAELNSNSCCGKDMDRYRKYQREYHRTYIRRT